MVWSTVFITLIITVAGLLYTPQLTNAGQLAQDPIPEQNVAPGVGMPGTQFAFYATGFNGNEKVSYWFNAPDGRVYGDKVDYVVYAYRGRADWTWQSPQDAPQGYWTAVAHGIGSNRQRVVHFIVGDPNTQAPISPAPPASDTTTLPPTPDNLDNPDDAVSVVESQHGVTPERGYQRERFIFNAAGFGSNEKVGYWFNDPAGRVYGDPGRHTVSDDVGHVRWEWVSPDDARPGVWEAVAQGWDTGHQVVLLFTVIDPSKPQLAPTTPDLPPSAAPVPNMLEPRPDLPPNVAEVAVEPMVALPGQQVAFSARGYPPREMMTYHVIAPDGVVYDRGKYTVKTDDTGTAYWHWRLPEDALDGIWQMKTEGTSVPLAYTIYFEGRNADALLGMVPGDMAVDPTAGTPGTRFFFYATGFPPGETVYYRAISPDGTEYAKQKYHVLSNEKGRADWNWRVPTDGAPGTWTMIVAGDKSFIKHQITFEVY